MGQKNQDFLRWIFLVLLLGGMLVCTACMAKRNQPKKEPTGENMAVEEKNVRDFLAVIRQVDAANGQILLRDVSENRELGLGILGSTEILSKNGEQMSASQLQPGDVLDVYMEPGTAKVRRLQISKEVKTYENAENMIVQTDESYISLMGKKFRYGAGLVVLSQGRQIELTEVAPTDVVTAKGKEGVVYSIVVEKGHGYIRPKNYKDFIGGKMTIAGEMIIGITENMLIPIREGIYEITMKKDGYIGTRSIQVGRDSETEVDMSLHKSQPDNMGQVVLDISPDGAEVYLDGKEARYDLPVSLAYGKHKLKVVLEGYQPYEGTLDVASANPTVRIDLAKETAEVDLKTDKTPSPSAGSMGEKSGYDGNHKITVHSPEGADVYLNGIYKGIAPVSFRKAVGTQTITLSKSGYTTKSYTVNISADGEDIQWNFAALEKKK